MITNTTMLILIVLAGSVCTSWIFWVAVFLMLVAMITYVMTGDLFWGVRGQSKTPPTHAPGR